MTISTTQQINTLLYYIKQQQEPPFPVLFYSAIAKTNLDYTPDSIQRLSHMLNQLAKKNFNINELLKQTGGTLFFLMIAAYLVDYLAKCTAEQVQWLSYNEVVQTMNDQKNEAQPLFPANFENSLLAKIGEAVFCQPLKAIYEHLLNENTIQSFIHQIQQETFNYSQINILAEPNKVCHDYLEKLKTEQLLDNTIGFFPYIQHIKFDYSQQSLQQIDEALANIKQTFQFSANDYHQIIEQSQNQAFCYLLGFYIGMTSAKLANTAVKWVNYEQMQALINDPDFIHCIEHSFVLLMENHYRTPILVITNHLFDITKEYPNSAVEFANIVKEENQGFFQLFRLDKQINVDYFANIPSNWLSVTQSAGFLLANNLLHLFDGGQVEPRLFEPNNYLVSANNPQNRLPSGHIEELKFEDSHWAIDNLYQQLNNNPKKLPFLVGSFDMHVNLPTGRVDGIALEIRCYHEPKLNIQLILPYRSAKDNRGFAIYPIISNQQETPVEINTLVQLLYKVAMGFKSPLYTGNFWENYYIDSLNMWTVSPLQQQKKSKENQLVEKISLEVFPIGLGSKLDNELIVEEIEEDENIEDIEKESILDENLPLVNKKETENIQINEIQKHQVKTEVLSSVPTQLEKPEKIIASVMDNMWQGFDLSNKIKNLPPYQREYLQVVVPEELNNDEIFSQIEAMTKLYHHGRVVWAVLIQTDSTMFQPDTHSSVGDVLYDPVGLASIDELRSLAKILQTLKDNPSTIQQTEQQFYINHLNDANSRLFNFNYPKSLANVTYRISTTWFWRNHLPSGMLVDDVFPIIVSDDTDGRVMVLPARFWGETLYQQWLDKTHQKFGVTGGFDLLPSIEHEEQSQGLYLGKGLDHRIFPKLRQLFPQESLSSVSNHQQIVVKNEQSFVQQNKQTSTNNNTINQTLSTDLQNQLLRDKQRLQQQLSTSDKQKEKKLFTILLIAVLVMVLAGVAGVFFK